jgi:hypothetical protein
VRYSRREIGLPHIQQRLDVSCNLLFKTGIYFMLKLIALNVVILGSLVCYQAQVERIVIPAHQWLVATLDRIYQ